MLDKKIMELLMHGVTKEVNEWLLLPFFPSMAHLHLTKVTHGGCPHGTPFIVVVDYP